MIEPTANVEPGAQLGDGTKVWARSHVRSTAVVGDNCNIGSGVFVDADVVVGNNCKIQNLAQLFTPARLGDGVFIGPGVILTNDVYPRAVSPDGKLLSADEWHADGVTVGEGAAVGARSVVVAGTTIGAWSLIGAGAVVTKDVAPHAMMLGNPARQVGWVGRVGRRLETGDDGTLVCPESGERYREVDGELCLIED
jgi:acetyltransferase-like isoleucine patch superfamily enzyme